MVIIPASVLGTWSGNGNWELGYRNWGMGNLRRTQGTSLIYYAPGQSVCVKSRRRWWFKIRDGKQAGERVRL